MNGVDRLSDVKSTLPNGQSQTRSTPTVAEQSSSTKQNKPENAAKAPWSRFKSVRKTPLRPILSSEILDAD
jgi:hypothetical protein